MSGSQIIFSAVDIAWFNVFTMEAQIDEILRKNQLSVTGSRKRILELFLMSNGALAHGDI